MNVKLTARIHLLPAKEAPFVAILRRKPSKTYHIIRWNTETDKFEHGSWFTGHIYGLRSDVSFDGKWMVYLARGTKGITWNGVCLLPFLKTYLECETSGTWFGGGYWKDQKTLLTNGWEREAQSQENPIKGAVPFRIQPMVLSATEDFGVGIPRMARDGWVRNGNNWGTDQKIRSPQYMIARHGDDGWRWQYQNKGPVLEAFYRGYLEHGYIFEFRLREFPDLLDKEVEWATFDAIGNLVFTRSGCVYRYSLKDMRRGKPGFVADLNGLTRESVESLGKK
jgi:hypothetical protein